MRIMNKNVARIFGLSTALIMLVSCSNFTLTNPTSTSQSVPVVNAAAVSVDWSKIEATADKFYQNNPRSNRIGVDKRAAQIYANEFEVSIAEAERRLLIQQYSSGLLRAIEQELKDNVVSAYFVNDDPKGFRIGLNTLTNLQCDRFIYEFKQGVLQGETITLDIHPNGEKTLEQILALKDKVTPEIFERYPNTQGVGYSPADNTISVSIYVPSSSKEYRQKVESELNKLVGHPVKVNFMSGRMMPPILLEESAVLPNKNSNEKR